MEKLDELLSKTSSVSLDSTKKVTDSIEPVTFSFLKLLDQETETASSVKLGAA